MSITDFEGIISHTEARKLGIVESDRNRISCQIRFACAFESKADGQAYFEMVARRDGQDYADRLRELALQHWKQKKGLM